MRNPWICILIVGAIGSVALVGMAGLAALAYVGRPLPGELSTIVGGAVGSLSSFLVMPPRGSVGGGAQP